VPGNPVAVFSATLHPAARVTAKRPLHTAQDSLAGGGQTFGIQRLADVGESALDEDCILGVKNMNAISQPNELVHGPPPFCEDWNQPTPAILVVHRAGLNTSSAGAPVGLGRQAGFRRKD